MSKIKITQIKSAIDRPHRQKDTLKALGLRKVGQHIEHDATAPVMGMVEKVKHLLRVENI